MRKTHLRRRRILQALAARLDGSHGRRSAPAPSGTSQACCQSHAREREQKARTEQPLTPELCCAGVDCAPPSHGYRPPRVRHPWFERQPARPRTPQREPADAAGSPALGARKSPLQAQLRLTAPLHLRVRQARLRVSGCVATQTRPPVNAAHLAQRPRPARRSRAAHSRAEARHVSRAYHARRSGARTSRRASMPAAAMCAVTNKQCCRSTSSPRRRGRAWTGAVKLAADVSAACVRVPARVLPAARAGARRALYTGAPAPNDAGC